MWYKTTENKLISKIKEYLINKSVEIKTHCNEMSRNRKHHDYFCNVTI